MDVIITAEEIARRINELANDIAERLPDDLLVIVVLRGSFMFAADLLRAMSQAGMSPDVEFLWLSSYGQGTVSPGHVRLCADLEQPVVGRNVLIIDDILDSGHTLAYAKDVLARRGARTISACVLLDKPSRRTQSVEVEFVGFTIADRFVVGYGLDRAGKFRELPYIGTPDEH